MEQQRKIAEGLLSIRAVFFRPEEPFIWASGIKSPVYCDNRLILTAPEVRSAVESALADTIRREYPDVQVLMGTSTAGIAHARHELVEHLLGLKVCNWDKTRALAHSEYDDAAGGVCESADRFPYVAGKRRGALLDLNAKIVRAHAP